MTTKESFLSHIAKQLGRQPVQKPPPRTIKGAPDFWKEKKGLKKTERIERFCHEGKQLGCEIQCFDSTDALREGLRALLQSLEPHRFLTWEPEVFTDWDLGQVLNEWKAFQIDSVTDRDEAITADVGITTVDFAIADTGTLVLWTNEQKRRAVSLYPAVHIAILHADQIRMSMGEVLAEFSTFQALNAPSSIHFISGPSRSSDIENDLSIGVHGPAAVHILLKQ
jgi:L-lactate dehydrogenase complex protein LldG